MTQDCIFCKYEHIPMDLKPCNDCSIGGNNHFTPFDADLFLERDEDIHKIKKRMPRE